MLHSTPTRARVVCALIACVFATVVHAQALEETKLAAARQLGQAGVELYQNGDTPGALEKLQRAYAVYAAPTLGLWYGRALERSGRLVEASERYREVSAASLSADASAAFRQAQTEARAALEVVLPRLAQLTVEVPGVDLARLHVTLDAVELPSALLGVAIPVNPGTHELKAVLGTQSRQQTLELRAGEPLTTSFAFPPEPIVAPGQAQKSGLQPAVAEPSASEALPRANIVIAMRAIQPELDACARGVSGTGVANLSIRGATGRVEAAKVTLDPSFVQLLFPSGLVTRERQIEYYNACLTRALQRAQFPRLAKAIVDIQYKFRFTPIPRQRSDAERAPGSH